MYVCLGNVLCSEVSNALRVVEALHVARIPGYAVGRCAAVATELADERRREGSLRRPTHTAQHTQKALLCVRNQVASAHTYILQLGTHLIVGHALGDMVGVYVEGSAVGWKVGPSVGPLLGWVGP